MVLVFIQRIKIRKLVSQIISDRRALPRKASLQIFLNFLFRTAAVNIDNERPLTLQYCRMELTPMAAYDLVIVIIIAYTATLNVYLFPNSYHLPLNAFISVLPFDTVPSINWALNYLQQFATMVSTANFFLVYFPISLLLMNHSCWVVDMAILSVVELEGSLSDKESRAPDCSVAEDSLKNVASMCLKVIEWHGEVRKVLQFSFLTEFSLISVILCLCIYSLTTNFSQLFFIMGLLQGSLSQVYVYSWMSSKFDSRVDKLAAALYDTNWYTLSVKQRKLLQIVLRMTQNVKGFHGVFKSLNLGAFQKVFLDFPC